MKNLILIALIFLFTLCTNQAQQYENHRTISVNGEAVVKVQPNQIVINFGIETWDKDIMTAKQQNNEIMKRAVTVIKESGVPDKEIQTDYLSVEPRYNDNYEKKDLIGYFVRNTFVVTMSDPEKVDNLVTAVLQSGVNYIHGIDFQATEFKKYREQARELALIAAKEKAEKMANVLGLSIGDPLQISEGYGGSDWWYYSSWSGWGYGRSNTMSQNIIQNIPGSSDQISEMIALGKISIKANVSVTFELKK